MEFNYGKICQGLLKELPEKTRDVLERRFGLRGERETLEAVGKKYGITRERVRQIERDGLSKLTAKTDICPEIFQYLDRLLKNSGQLRKEETLFELAGPARFQNHIFFFLSLGQGFERHSEDQDFYSLWTIDQSALNFCQEIIDSLLERFEAEKKPTSFEQLCSCQKDLASDALLSYIEVSKKIIRGPEGLFGLRDWPEITPKGVKDKAYLVFKEQGEPLHFTKVAELIDKMQMDMAKKTLARTVHNELIKDPRFVLVGRGLYGLREWGYEDGRVRDVILQILKQQGQPMARQAIVDKVLKQRMVKPNTILLNLNNKEYFSRDEQGRYYTAV